MRDGTMTGLPESPSPSSNRPSALLNKEGDT